MNQKIKWISFGIGATLLVQLLAAWKPAGLFEEHPFAAAALACSADGRIVYAADLDGIHKSEDAGKTWVVIKHGDSMHLMEFRDSKPSRR